MSFPPFNPAPLAGDSPDFAGGYAIGGQLAVNTEVNLDGTGFAQVCQNVFVGAAAGLNFHFGLGFAGHFRATISWGPKAGVITTSLDDIFFKNTQVPTIFQLPVKAPFMSITLDAGTADLQNVSVDVEAIAPGAYGAPYFQPSLLIDQQNQAIGANGTVNYVPTVMMPGEMSLYDFGTQIGHAILLVWTGAAWDFASGVEFASGANTTSKFVAPLSDWQIQVANKASAGGNFWTSVVGPG